MRWTLTWHWDPETTPLLRETTPLRKVSAELQVSRRAGKLHCHDSISQNAVAIFKKYASTLPHFRYPSTYRSRQIKINFGLKKTHAAYF